MISHLADINKIICILSFLWMVYYLRNFEKALFRIIEDLSSDEKIKIRSSNEIEYFTREKI